MPRIKTNKSAAKRFAFTRKGKIKRRHSFARHLATGKTAKRKRQLRRTALVDKTDVGRVKKLVPYR
jgi:large subunit ribosomal protein L35